MFVKPAKDRSVRWPGTMRLLNAAGENVPDTSFWLRALARGDVQKATPTTSQSVPAAAPAQAQTDKGA
ncbi:DUF2635 domain-containing protein [Acetobacter pasteurianus]|uniref:DUF2635 domain-containing protein n=1 Tax=Acetobacter pasteurianus subsp. pasteurianus TaxID=481145 RepID=A0A1Y0Y2T1_ACEPA|nr:DUF2635 domain-containing protein [Acetobacter pasteurianus]ARW48742.1 hypothetical protein S1001342_02443 [Acetobacter pasteurianus subsp. pasteurianus]